MKLNAPAVSGFMLILLSTPHFEVSAISACLKSVVEKSPLYSQQEIGSKELKRKWEKREIQSLKHEMEGNRDFEHKETPGKCKMYL